MPFTNAADQPQPSVSIAASRLQRAGGALLACSFFLPMTATDGREAVSTASLALETYSAIAKAEHTLSTLFMAYIGPVILFGTPALMGILVFIGYTVRRRELEHLGRVSGPLAIHPTLAIIFPIIAIPWFYLIDIPLTISALFSVSESIWWVIPTVFGATFLVMSCIWLVALVRHGRKAEPCVRAAVTAFLTIGCVALLTSPITGYGTFVALTGAAIITYAAFREIQIRAKTSTPQTITAIITCRRLPLENDPTRCSNCGYNITHLTTPRCPECGQPCTIPTSSTQPL